MRNEIDDRITVRLGDLREKVDALRDADPGNPSIGVIVRRLIAYGLEHEQKCKAKKKEVA